MEDKIFTLGAPRSGFTLLIGIMHKILSKRDNITASKDRKVNNKLIAISSIYLKEYFFNFFNDKINMDDFMYNGEFDLLVGGPKWINQDNYDECVIRKYIGIKDNGDFTFLLYLPKKALNYDRVVHSHYFPKSWIDDDYYSDYNKFVSIRNPIGILNSAVFSINAITSEYITRYIDDFNEDEFREVMALYKLTDLDLFEGLVKFLINYLDELLQVREHFTEIKWEDIIQHPHETIKYVAQKLDVSLDEEQIKDIWQQLDHINIPKYHLYNFRKGFGIVGEWKNRLTNHHLRILEKYNFNKYLDAFNYDKIEYFDESKYSDFQKIVNNHIDENKICNNITDDNLFKFCWNKSNIAVTSHKFDRFTREKYSSVERSSLVDSKLAKDFSKYIDPKVSIVNQLLQQYSDDNSFANFKDMFFVDMTQNLSKESIEKIEILFDEIQTLQDGK